MEESTITTLLALALTLPTASILPFVFYILKAVNELNDRLDAIEACSRCPFNGSGTK